MAHFNAGLRGLFLVDLSQKIDHFDGAQRGFPSFIAALGAGAFERLFEIIAGQQAKRHGNPRIQRGARDAFARFVCDIIKVRRSAANDTTQRDDCVAGRYFCNRTAP